MCLCDPSLLVVDAPLYDPSTKHKVRPRGGLSHDEGAMERVKDLEEYSVKVDEKKSEEPRVCSMCGNPATQLVDGEPSCAAHVGQIYEHQVEDFTSKHLHDNEWRKV